MCYRYSVPGPKELEQAFQAEFEQNETFSKRYHVSGFDLPLLPVITNDEPKKIQLLTWGLIPFWVKNKTNAEELRLKTMNARSETLYEKPAFRSAAEQHRCLVLADGFFEWREYNGKNYPYYIRLKNHKPFAFAGVWDKWTNLETQETLQTYSVVTTKANPLMEKIHNKKKRMPVILHKNDETAWLQDATTAALAASLFQPYPQDEMEAFTISRLITTKNKNPDVPEVITPYRYPELTEHSSQRSLV